MEFGIFLYEMYKEELLKHRPDYIPWSWDDLEEPVKRAWDALAKRIKKGETI